MGKHRFWCFHSKFTTCLNLGHLLKFKRLYLFTRSNCDTRLFHVDQMHPLCPASLNLGHFWSSKRSNIWTSSSHNQTATTNRSFVLIKCIAPLPHPLLISCRCLKRRVLISETAFAKTRTSSRRSWTSWLDCTSYQASPRTPSSTPKQERRSG